MSRPYLLHGEKHANGEDPIPGLGGSLKWAALDCGSVTVAANTFDGVAVGATNQQFYTNDTSVFEQGSGAVGTHTRVGITMLVAGHYLVEATLVPTSALPDGFVYRLQPGNSGDADESTFYMVPSTRIVPTGEHAAQSSVGGNMQTISWKNIQSLGDGFVAPPATFIPSCSNLDATRSMGAELYVVIYYLDSDTTFIG